MVLIFHDKGNPKRQHYIYHKNTLFALDTWNGYGAILADGVSTATIKNNMIVVNNMRDNAANSVFGFEVAGTSANVITENVTMYKTIVNRNTSNAAALICRVARSDKLGTYHHNVGVSSVTDKMFDSDVEGYYASMNAKVDDLEALVAQGQVEGYEYLNTLLSVKEGHYYWGSALVA